MDTLQPEEIEKNPTPVGHPLLEMDPPAKTSPNLFQWCETCVDLLEAVLKHHNGGKLEK
jgi:hypothetical protein